MHSRLDTYVLTVGPLITGPPRSGQPPRRGQAPGNGLKLIETSMKRTVRASSSEQRTSTPHRTELAQRFLPPNPDREAPPTAFKALVTHCMITGYATRLLFAL